MNPAGALVLVVDDSPATLGVLNQALEMAGFRVVIAQDGAGALALVGRVTPDIVLMDALMPSLDGFETCRRMKLLPDLAAVPIVFMTGLTETGDVIRGLEAGGVDYVTKPVAPDEVIARIQVHLANARLTRSAQGALDAAGRFLLAVDPSGRTLWSTPQAARLLQEAGDACSTLPDAAVSWIRRRSSHPAEFTRGITVALDGSGKRQVEIAFIGQVTPDELLLRLIAHGPNEVAVLRDALQLTAREGEVLLWISRGKPNRDIAEILGISPRTVSKHLEQVFEKLGVENRTAATALAIHHLQRPSP